MHFKTSKQATHSSQGFTLVETLLSVFILSFLLVSTTALMNKFISATTVTQDRYLATKLAAEGLELLKAKRNRNVAAAVNPWTTNLIGTWEVDSTQQTAIDTTSSFLIGDPLNPRVLCRRTSPASQEGKYSHICGTDAEMLPGNFTRIIEVTSLSAYSLQVTDIVN